MFIKSIQMKSKFSLSIFSFFIFLLIVLEVNAQTEMEVIEVSVDLYTIINPRGGNIAFLVTRKGVVVVDAGSTPSDGEKIVSAIKSVSNKPIKHLILTHLHGDHINGVAGFPDDVKIIAHADLEKNNAEFNERNLTNYKENIFPNHLANLKIQLDSIADKESDDYQKLMKQYNDNLDYFEDVKKIKFRKPDITFEDFYRFKIADERIMLEYPGPGHTSDNIVVKFSNHNVIHVGDLVFSNSFPYTIAEHGVDIYNWVKTLDDLYKENITTVIPGHGEIGNKDILKEQSYYFKSLALKIERMKNEGLQLDQIIEKCDIKDFDLIGNENQFPVNIEVIYTQLINTKIEWWKF